MTMINTEMFAPRNMIPIIIIIALSGWIMRKFIHPKMEG